MIKLKTRRQAQLGVIFLGLLAVIEWFCVGWNVSEQDWFGALIYFLGAWFITELALGLRDVLKAEARKGKDENDGT